MKKEDKKNKEKRKRKEMKRKKKGKKKKKEENTYRLSRDRASEFDYSLFFESTFRKSRQVLKPSVSFILLFLILSALLLSKAVASHKTRLFLVLVTRIFLTVSTFYVNEYGNGRCSLYTVLKNAESHVTNADQSGRFLCQSLFFIHFRLWKFTCRFFHYEEIFITLQEILDDSERRSSKNTFSK